jgi:outer membrane protein TolC
MIAARTRRVLILLLVAELGLALSGCRVGPEYVRPSAPTAPSFKEAPPENFKSEDGWKPAQPSDAQVKGDWWTLFDDPQLNSLEAQIDPANQTLKQAEANFRAARAAVRFNRASEAPTIGVEPTVGAVRDSSNQPYFNTAYANNGEGNFVLPFDLDYEIDLWGRVRRTVAQAREQAQASAADLETSRLSLHAELAVDYFNLRSDDAQRRLLNDTVKAFQSALQLIEDRYNGGASPLSDVTQARAQLQAAQVQATMSIFSALCTNMRSPLS